MKKTVVIYRVLGIPVWSRTILTDEPEAAAPFDKEALFKEFSERVFKQLDQAVLNMRRGGA